MIQRMIGRLIREACAPDIPPVEHKPHLTGPCANCEAACCQSRMRLPLTYEEFVFMTGKYWRPYDNQNFTTGQATTDPEVYMHTLRTDCPALDPATLTCRLRNDERRPGVCTTFEPGSDGCQKIQVLGLAPEKRIRFARRCAARILRAK